MIIFSFWPLFHIHLRLSLKVIRVKSRRTLFQRYHNSITDSTANGSNNIVILIVLLLFSTTFTVSSFLSSIGLSGISLSFNNFPPIYFLVMTAYTIFGSTCFLWNLEFRNFLLRKIVATCRDVFSRKSRSRTYPLREEPWTNYLNKKENIAMLVVKINKIIQSNNKIMIEFETLKILAPAEAAHSTHDILFLGKP